MIDLALLELADAAYGTATLETATCHVLIREIENTEIVAFRGTDPGSFTDLLRDADAALGTISDPVLGPVTDAFYEDVVSLAWRLIPKLSAPLVMLTGHSKGGAEALVFGAMLAHVGRPPARLTTFGAARPGALAGLLSDIPGSDYRNGSDPVPLLPPTLSAPRPNTAIGSGVFTFNPFADHALAAYRGAVASHLSTAE